MRITARHAAAFIGIGAVIFAAYTCALIVVDALCQLYR